MSIFLADVAFLKYDKTYLSRHIKQMSIESANQSTTRSANEYLHLLRQDQTRLSALKQRILSANVVSEDEFNFLFHYNDLYAQCHEFTQRYLEKTQKPNDGQIDREFVRQMVLDELDELARAKDVVEEIDALVDAIYYILQHVSRTSLPFNDVFRLVHYANMTKFGSGGKMLPNGKWQKPANFVPPDEDIRTRILENLV